MKYLMCLALVISVVGCDQFKITPVDVTNQAIVGYWYGEKQVNEQGWQVWQRAYLHVREDGYAYYHNLLCRQYIDGTGTNSSELKLDYMPIKDLTPTTILLQKYPMTPKFQLTIGRWPNSEDQALQLDEFLLERKTASMETNVWRCGESDGEGLE